MLSKSIIFREEIIGKEDFTNFIETINEINVSEYEEELKDGFEDLYNYWINKGRKRFLDKFYSNLRRIKN